MKVFVHLFQKVAGCKGSALAKDDGFRVFDRLEYQMNG